MRPRGLSSAWLTRCPPYHWRPTSLHPAWASTHGAPPCREWEGWEGPDWLQAAASSWKFLPEPRMAGTLKITRKNCQGGVVPSAWSLTKLYLRRLHLPSKTVQRDGGLPFKSKHKPESTCNLGWATWLQSSLTLLLLPPVPALRGCPSLIPICLIFSSFTMET